MWELYDRLIAGVPEELHVKRAVAGSFWTAVESELGVGVSGTAKSMTRPPLARITLEGAPLKQVAALSKSWNFVEASIGVAALNAYYNSPEIAKKNGVLFDEGDDRLNDPYIVYRNFVRDKKVACIGSNSTVVESLLKNVAEVSLLGEEFGSFPVQAADYLLPEQDLVYLPCYSEITKELPRYLSLCQNTVAVVCGPSITMSPLLFDYGAFDLAGLVITDADMAFESACGTAVKKMFAAGKKASLRKKPVSEL
ncbi:MAG: DUF4213 domain-containing proteins [Eubacteriales bacterium]|nr:DUF4213 domain-containing proteins [Eubacteriales bacterium]